jgi:hypothetical protein
MTQQRQAVQYGLWPSSIQTQHLAEGLRLTDVAWDSDGKTLVWHEGRSDRGVLVCLSPDGDAPQDLTTDLSVRARVGYGGGDFSVAGGDVYFVDASGRLYRQSLASGPARPLTPAFGYAAAPTVSPNFTPVSRPFCNAMCSSDRGRRRGVLATVPVAVYAPPVRVGTAQFCLISSLAWGRTGHFAQNGS